MRTGKVHLASAGRCVVKISAMFAALLLLTAGSALAQPTEEGGEAALKLPDLSSVSFLGVNGHSLLTIGLLFCVFGLGFGMIILVFSLVGIAGSYGVAWFGIRVNTFANSRTAFASLPGKPYPVYQIPLE